MTTSSASMPGHNSGLDPAQERAFIVNYPRLVEAEAEMAASKGEMAGIYKALEAAGFTKDDIKWWNKTKATNVGEALETMKRRIGLTRLMGHGLGRRMDLFDKDRTPIEDAAYEEGRAVGLIGGDNINPYGMETVAGQNWQRGLNEGHAERNKILAEAMSDQTIKSGADDDDDDADETSDAEDGDDDDAGGADNDNDDDDWDAHDPSKKTAEAAE